MITSISIIVDDFSKATWVYLLSCKSNALPLPQSFIACIENNFGVLVKIVTLDNEEELKDNTIHEFYAKKGIAQQTSL